ncbi:MAG TPA: hypothetical protein VJZ77_15200 [Blastocatellia bacterium]|nr:hypothetical protein [Blastocatellia bacterium]
MGSAYLPALALSLRLTLLAVNVDLSQAVNIYNFFPVCWPSGATVDAGEPESRQGTLRLDCFLRHGR